MILPLTRKMGNSRELDTRELIKRKMKGNTKCYNILSSKKSDEEGEVEEEEENVNSIFHYHLT